MRLPTIRDVAREAGVGVGTVSRVLNDSGQVSAETRARVLEAIRTLGYRPNQVARHLSLGTRRRAVGIISPFVTGHAFMDRLEGVQMALSEAGDGMDLILYNVATPQRYHQRLLTIAEQGIVAGLLVIVLGLDADQRALLGEVGIRYVGIDDSITSQWPSLGSDNVLGGYLATDYLLELGHRAIAYVGDQLPAPNEFQFIASQARQMGYRQALAAWGLDVRPEYVQVGPHGRAEAYALTRRLLALPQPPSALFCMSDVQALGALAAIRDAGLHVPDDISVVGYDDVEISQVIGLTTVRQHLNLGGYLSMRYLLALLHNEAPATGPPTLPPPELVERQTTRRIA